MSQKKKKRVVGLKCSIILNQKYFYFLFLFINFLVYRKRSRNVFKILGTMKNNKELQIWLFMFLILISVYKFAKYKIIINI